MVFRFREIEVFWAVYKGQSVKEAARLLHVSQPAVSMMLKSAEDRLGHSLFHRTNAGLQPTPEARHLFVYAQFVFISLKELERQATLLRNGNIGTIRVAAPLTLAATLVHPALAWLQNEYPGMSISVRTVSSELAQEMVVGRQVDFGIVYGTEPADGFAFENLGTSRLACAVRDDHRLARRRVVTLPELQQENIASYRREAPFGQRLEAALQACGTSLDVAVRSNALMALQLATSGTFVALVDPIALHSSAFQRITLCPLELSVTDTIRLIYLRDAKFSAMTRKLVGDIRDRWRGIVAAQQPTEEGPQGQAWSA